MNKNLTKGERIFIAIPSILLFTLIIIFQKQVVSQTISARELSQIVDLYKQEDFVSMKAIILSKGFYTTKSITEYTADGNKYKDVFEFKREAFASKFKGSETVINLTDELKFETIDFDFYKNLEIHFYFNCQFCTDNFTEEMVWKYKTIEGWKSSGQKKSLTFNKYDSLLVEDIKDPNSVFQKNFYCNLELISSYSDFVSIPFYTFYGTFNLQVPYSPINCSKEEYFNRMNSKKKIYVPIRQVQGGYKIKINVGGKIVDYLIDSGASVITIDSKTETFLIENNIIAKINYLPSAKYQLADGTVKEYKRVTIPWMTVNGILVKNVIAAISNSESAPLLGKSFFDKFIYWKINNVNSTIELQPK